MLADLDVEAEQIGLKLHPDETKIQHNGIGYGVGVNTAKCGRITVEVLPNGEQTSYLGRVINLRDLHDSELHNRIAKAWAKFGIFKGELTDPAIPIHLRIETVRFRCDANRIIRQRGVGDELTTPTKIDGHPKENGEADHPGPQIIRSLRHPRRLDQSRNFQGSEDHARQQRRMLDNPTKKENVEMGRKAIISRR